MYVLFWFLCASSLFLSAAKSPEYEASPIYTYENVNRFGKSIRFIAKSYDKNAESLSNS